MKMLLSFGCGVSSKWTMLSILLIDSMARIVAGDLTAVVNTTLGPVQGEVRTTALNSMKYAAFKGIRYGKPPVGYLRFKPPVPADPWTKTLNATTEATHCVRIESGTFAGSEDCLFLNVFTPVTNLEEAPKKLKSVVIYIYGGAWMTGASRIAIYGPDFFIERDVLMVSFNYRGGAFGFLSLNHPNATGNAGLKDQNLVLKWTQANIKYFGGNPNNVTIMGASSGGMSVGYHVISDASVGLFHGAISMSGTPLMPWAFQTPAKALLRAQRIGIDIGATKTDTKSLLKAYYDASATQIAYTTYLMGEIITFAPTIENASIATDIFLSKCSVKKYLSGNFTKVPQMLGFMDQETITYASCRNEDMGEYYRLVSDAIDVVTYIGMGVPQLLSSFLNISASVDFEHMTKAESTTLEATIDETTAILYVTQIDLVQRILAAYNEGKPLFYYHISFAMERSPHSLLSSCPIKAAGHADEVAYLFYTSGSNYTYHPSDPMTRTVYRVTTMWMNFVKYGNPTPDWVDEYPLNITWPESGSKGISLNIGDELIVEPRPVTNLVKEIETYYWVFLCKINACR